MKSKEFIIEGDDKSAADVKQNHPEVYQFLNNLVGYMALDRATVEAYDTAANHMVRIAIKPSAGLGNTLAGLKQNNIPHEEFEFASGMTIQGTFDDTHWTVKEDGRRGNITEVWLFALPHNDPEQGYYKDRTMEAGRKQKPAKQNWFDTLQQALESEGLEDAWDSMTMGGIGYGETKRWTWDDGTRNGHLITIYRDERGMYERPVHYKR